MALYELINPSDPYTFDTDDLEALQMGILFWSDGQYGLTDEKGEDALPILAFGGLEPWLTEKFGSKKAGLDWYADKRHMLRVADAVSTVSYGKPGERKALMAALSAVKDPDERRAAMKAFIEERRTSMNDIGGSLLRWAEHIQEKVKA